MRVLFIALLVVFACEDENDGLKCDPVTDIDGNEYQTVQIGNQCWMAENLKTTHFRNGDEITYAVYPHDNNSFLGQPDLPAATTCGGDCAEVYGNLYNRYAVDDSRNIAPEGWHVPTDDEYTILTEFLGGNSIAGGKLKEAGFGHWNSPNEGATNRA